jgi:hypothetical protein
VKTDFPELLTSRKRSCFCSLHPNAPFDTNTAATLALGMLMLLLLLLLLQLLQFSFRPRPPAPGGEGLGGLPAFHKSQKRSAELILFTSVAS